MRFACFHGRGINAQIFASQTGAIQYELGDGHTYEFVQGTFPALLAPELNGTSIGEPGPLSYFDEESTGSMLNALKDLGAFLEEEGPFDGVIAFSLSAALISTWLIDRLQKGSTVPFRCAVFFSAASPVCYDSLQEGRMVDLKSEVGREIITIPTAHMWGAHDRLAESASNLSGMCKPDKRSVFVHSRGHDVPTSGDDLMQAVNVIRRCLVLAEENE